MNANIVVQMGRRALDAEAGLAVVEEMKQRLTTLAAAVQDRDSALKERETYIRRADHDYKQAQV